MVATAQKECFVIAGGGTGGHLFPGLAVAEELRLRKPGAETLFVIGHRRMEAEILSRHRQSTRTIDVEGIKGRGWFGKMSSFGRLPRSFLQSRAILQEHRPLAVIGMGGYSAGPVCLAAKWLGVPTAIHEQNSYPGLTNRWLSRFVDLVFISFEQSREHLKGKRVALTGNPVRRDILRLREKSPPPGEPFTVLVVGGSQGARAINKAFVDALEILDHRGKAPKVIHQTGKEDLEAVRQAYASKGLEAEIHPFIVEMGEAYAQAHLVLGRAGATTVFELAALGKPSVLVPYPLAVNNHQEFNASSLVDAGGAVMLRQAELTAEKLAETLAILMRDPGRLEEMGRSVAALGRPNAAEHIVDLLLDYLAERAGLDTEQSHSGDSKS